MYYYIPEKSVYALPYGRSCKYIHDIAIYWMMTFAILHWDTSPAFQPIAEGHVVYVYVLLFILAALPRSQARCYMPWRHEKEKHWSKGMSKWSCLKDLISCNMSTKLRSRYIIIVLSHLSLVQGFIYIWINSCIPTQDECSFWSTQK